MTREDEEYISKRVEELLTHFTTKPNLWKQISRAQYGGRQRHREILKRLTTVMKLMDIRFERRFDGHVTTMRSVDFPPLHSPQNQLLGTTPKLVVLDDIVKDSGQRYTWISPTGRHKSRSMPGSRNISGLV